MKRLAHVAALLFGGEAGVHADSDIYTNMLKQPRGDNALHADTAVCDPDARGCQRTQRQRETQSAASGSQAAWPRHLDCRPPG